MMKMRDQKDKGGEEEGHVSEIKFQNPWWLSLLVSQ